MKQHIYVVDASTQVERDVVAVFADFIAFEAKWNKSVADISTRITLTELSWLAWSCEHRNKVTALDYDAWCLTVESAAMTPDAYKDDASEAAVAADDNVIVPLESNQRIGL